MALVPLTSEGDEVKVALEALSNADKASLIGTLVTASTDFDPTLQDPPGITGKLMGTTSLGAPVSYNNAQFLQQRWNYEIGDETTALTVGLKKTDMARDAIQITDIRLFATTAPTGANLIVDIKKAGTTIFTTKPRIEVGENSSTTSSVPHVLASNTFAKDDILTIHVDQIGSTIAGAGLKVLISGTRDPSIVPPPVGFQVNEGASTGTFSSSGGYRIWTGPGDLVVTNEGDANVLRVGGGGGGGGRSGGGGGGGEYLSRVETLAAGTYTAIVGTGGTAGSNATPGTTGGDTTFNGVTMKGGGVGGTAGGGNAGTGGSGGGANPTSTPAGVSNKTIGLGNNGGGSGTTATSAGSGGGAGSAGTLSGTINGSTGGSGVPTPVPGETGGYGAGGGTAALSGGSVGPGGVYGGGDGQGFTSGLPAATAGATGRGCGGGGGNATNAQRQGAAGSAGAVKVWWPE